MSMIVNIDINMILTTGINVIIIILRCLIGLYFLFGECFLLLVKNDTPVQLLWKIKIVFKDF